jgi:hypothetical protein
VKLRIEEKGFEKVPKNRKTESQFPGELNSV